MRAAIAIEKAESKLLGLCQDSHGEAVAAALWRRGDPPSNKGFSSCEMLADGVAECIEA